MTSRHRIVCVVPDLQIAGAERQVVDLVNNLDPARFDVTLFTFNESTDLAPMIRKDRVEFVRVPRRFRVDPRPAEHLARLLREREVDLVHATLQMSILVASLAIARCGRRVPLVGAIHTTETHNLKEKVADQLLYVPLMRRCERIIMVCETQRSSWAAKYPALASQMVTVHNGIDLERFRDTRTPEQRAEHRRQLGFAPEDVVCGMLAAVRPEKNHVGILAAAAKAVKACPRLRFLFVGGAVRGLEQLEAHVRAEATARGLDPYVRWMGKLPDPRPAMSLFDISIQFSTSTETFPLALLESLAMGKPVVASHIAGVPEMVQDGRNGLLVPVGDVDAFAAALARIGSDGALRAKLSAEARPSVEARFSVGKMVRSTEAVLLDVLSGGAQAVALRGDASPQGGQSRKRRRVP